MNNEIKEPSTTTFLETRKINRKAIPNEVFVQIVKDLKSGMFIKAVAEKHNVSQPTVSMTIKRLNNCGIDTSFVQREKHTYRDWDEIFKEFKTN